MKAIIKTVILLVMGSSVYAQDYFSDLNSGSTPILSSDLSRVLFSATINAGDNSVKTNFFRQYSFAETRRPDKTLEEKHYWGWGINTKAAVESGLASLFGSGKLTSGFTGGGYLALSSMHWDLKNR